MMINQQAMIEFVKSYSQMTDAQLLGLYVERDAFLSEAHSALLSELQKRSLTQSAALAEQRRAVESARTSSEGVDEELFAGVFGRR